MPIIKILMKLFLCSYVNGSDDSDLVDSNTTSDYDSVESQADTRYSSCPRRRVSQMLAARLLAKIQWPKHVLESVCEPLKQHLHKYTLASKWAGGCTVCLCKPTV